MNYPFNSAYFINDDMGFVVGGQQHGHGLSYGDIYVTTDGGESWEIIFGVENEEIRKCILINDTIGYIVTHSGWGGSNIYKTSDGGRNWNDVNLTSPLEPWRIL